MKKTILKLAGILAVLAMVFVNVYYTFDEPSNTDVNLAFFETNLKAYANEHGNVVRKPAAVLCDVGTKFKTICVGSGNGCDPTQC